MPRGKGAGPGSTGATSGNGAGGQGRGRMNRGAGRGAARGICGWFNASELSGHTSQENEARLLQAEAAALSKRQEDVSRRLSELGK